MLPKRHRITIGPGTHGCRIKLDIPWECALPDGTVVPLEAGESYLVPKVDVEREVERIERKEEYTYGWHDPRKGKWRVLLERARAVLHEWDHPARQQASVVLVTTTDGVPYAHGVPLDVCTVWETDPEPATGGGGDRQTLSFRQRVIDDLYRTRVPATETGRLSGSTPNAANTPKTDVHPDLSVWAKLEAELAESMTRGAVRMMLDDWKQAQKVADVLRRPGTRPLHWEVDFSVVPEPVMVDPKELWSLAPLPEAARSCGCLAPAVMLQWTECPVSPDQCRWRRFLSEKS